MNNIPIYRKTPIHIVSRQHFPPLLGRRKEKFLKTAESFIVARDPFERLLSSFKVNHKNECFVMTKSCLARTSLTWPSDQPWWPGTASVRFRESSNTNTETQSDLGPSHHSESSSSIWWDLFRHQRWLRQPDWGRGAVAQHQDYEENDAND